MCTLARNRLEDSECSIIFVTLYIINCGQPFWENGLVNSNTIPVTFNLSKNVLVSSGKTSSQIRIRLGHLLCGSQ